MPHLVLVSTRIVTRRVPTVNVHFQIILMWILSTAAIDVANSSQGGAGPRVPDGRSRWRKKNRTFN